MALYDALSKNIDKRNAQLLLRRTARQRKNVLTQTGATFNAPDADSGGGFPASGLSNPVDYIKWAEAPAGVPVDVSVMSWNAEDGTIDVQSGIPGVTFQLSQETVVPVINQSGSTIPDGSVVYIDGASSGRPEAFLADASSIDTTKGVLGIATSDILNTEEGFVTIVGKVRGIDTSGCAAGDMLYLDAGTPGAFTPDQPIYPNFIIVVAQCLTSDASDGEITIGVIGRPEDILENGWNGNFLEPINFTITEAAGVITGNLERNGGGELTMNFAEGFEILDTDPAVTITLTAGAAGVLQSNFLYVPLSTKVLTLSLTEWPSEEHIKVSKVQLRTAALTSSEGAMVNRNINNGVAEANQIGHIMAIGERIRKEPARYQSPGIDYNLVIDTVPTPDDLTINTTEGMVYQLHLQEFPAFDTAVSDVIHIVNDPTNPYDSISNLNTLLTDALSGALTNRSFSFVLWGVQNRAGEPSQLMLNLPTGSYQKNNPASAVSDAFNFSVYDIPEEFEGVGFLIARFTLTLDAPGNSWTLFGSPQDLRGFTPNTSAGGGGGGTGVTQWTQLSDTPLSFASEAGSLPVVNAGETALEFSLVKVGSAGDVTGINTMELTSQVGSVASSGAGFWKFQMVGGDLVLTDDLTSFNIMANIASKMGSWNIDADTGGATAVTDNDTLVISGGFGITTGKPGVLEVSIDADLEKSGGFTDNRALRADGSTGLVQHSACYIDDAGKVGAGVATPHSHLQALGSLAADITTLSTGTTLDDTHCVVENDQVGAGFGWTITLPAASTCAGRHYWIKNTDRNKVAGGYNITLATTGGDTIENGAGSILASGQSVHLVANAAKSDWQIHA